MNKSNLIFLLVTVLFAACGSDEEQPVLTAEQQLLSAAGYTEVDEVFVGSYKRYTGTVAGKPVVLSMTEYGESIEAEYYYEHIGKDIDLYFIADSSDKNAIYLKEATRRGSDEYPHWEVVLKADTISGKWIAHNGKKTYPILLVENYTNNIQQFGLLSVEDTIQLFDTLAEPYAEYKYQTLMPIGKDEGSVFVRSVILSNMGCDTSHRKMNACLDEMKEKYSDEYQSLQEGMSSEDELSAFNNWDHIVNLSVQYNENNFVVLDDFIYEYTGGAHGNFNSTFINIDRADKKVLELSDIITVDSNELLALLEVQARLHFGLNERQGLNSRLFSNELHIAQNFYIGRKGITFVYGLYEIASYADGIIELHIPYSKLTSQLTPYFKKRMNLETVAIKQ